MHKAIAAVLFTILPVALALPDLINLAVILIQRSI